MLLAEELGWTPRAVQQLEEATYLHDIGKIAVADRVLLKSGPLTDEEWELMQQHPVVSAEIIESLLDDDYVAGVRHHHERWDGERVPGRAGRRGRSRWWRGCSAWWTPTTPCRRAASTARRSPTASASPSWSAAPARSSTPDLVAPFMRVLERMREQRDALQAAADEAAAVIDAGDHLAVSRHEDVAQRGVRAHPADSCGRLRLAHPQVQSMVTTAPVDELRCMIVVDDDDDDAGRGRRPAKSSSATTSSSTRWPAGPPTPTW